jgi:hypothetical protein
VRLINLREGEALQDIARVPRVEGDDEIPTEEVPTEEVPTEEGSVDAAPVDEAPPTSESEG